MRVWKHWTAWGAGVVLLSCSTLDMSVDDGPTTPFASMRRIYANDSAANDSLPAALAVGGVRFVLQPGIDYGLRMDSSLASDRVGLYLYDNGLFKSFGSYSAQVTGGAGVFPLRSNRAAADFFVAVLQNGNAASSSRIRRVRLAPITNVESAVFEIRLLVIRQIALRPTTGDRAALADNLIAKLKALYFTYGITLNGSYELVEPGSPPVSIPFNGGFVDLPGTRISGAINLYLVDDITSSTIYGTILGFAPREAVSMSGDLDSRIILNGHASESLLVTTAAHEIGHFLGLRHTTATSLELNEDGDYSNRDDGFLSTPDCAVLTKVSASAEPDAGGFTPGSYYCPYQSAASCPPACDATDLMFPYDCPAGPGGQRILTTGQQVILRRNLALLQP